MATPVGRASTAFAALTLAAAAFAFVLAAFSRDRGVSPTEPGTLAPTAENGSIYYRVESNDGESWVGAVELDGSGQRVVFPQNSPVHYEQLAFSPDGARIAYVDARDGHSGIYVADADGTDAIRLTDGVNDSWPAWSPDGSRIAFVGTSLDPTIGFCDPGVYVDCLTNIYTMAADGSNIARLTHDPGVEYDPAWSPDSARLAYARTRPNPQQPTAIYVMNADGSGATKVSSSIGGSDSDPSWSLGGTLIVFGVLHLEDWGLFAVRPDGTNERELLWGLGTYAIEPAWSPDGSLVAFGGHVKGDVERSGIYVMRPDGSDVMRVADIPEGWWVREIT